MTSDFLGRSPADKRDGRTSSQSARPINEWMGRKKKTKEKERNEWAVVVVRVDPPILFFFYPEEVGPENARFSRILPVILLWRWRLIFWQLLTGFRHGYFFLCVLTDFIGLYQVWSEFYRWPSKNSGGP